MCNAIAPEKDVDGFHIVNIGKLCLDQRSMVPATPAAVWEMIKRAGKQARVLNFTYVFFILFTCTFSETIDSLEGSKDLLALMVI